MSSDLRVAVFGGCPFFEIHAAQDSVFSKLSLDREHCFLHLSFAVKISLFLLAFCVENSVIRVEVKLLIAALRL